MTIKNNGWGVYWQQDGKLISDRDNNGREFYTMWDACKWAFKNILRRNVRDKEWYVVLVSENQNVRNLDQER